LIKYICFSAKVAFKDIFLKNPKLVVFTSGCLPPFEAAEKIVGRKFDIG